MMIRICALVLPVFVMGSPHKLNIMVNISHSLDIAETVSSIKLEGSFYFSNFFCDILQVLLQTSLIKCILHEDFECRITGAKRTVFLTTLQFVGMSNFLFWVNGSFLDFGVFQRTPWSNLFYTKKVWTIINQFTSPLALFYRFFCVHMIWEQYHECASSPSPEESQNRADDLRPLVPSLFQQPSVIADLIEIVNMLIRPCCCQNILAKVASCVRRHQQRVIWRCNDN